MTTERFATKDFEEALDWIAGQVECKWSSAGMFGGEHHYTIDVKTLRHNAGKVVVRINSSIGVSGYADGTGENSIRAWLTDGFGNPLGSKIQKYITRVAGWQDRLLVVIDKLVARGMTIEFCNECASIEKIFQVKKEGKNHGRLFIKCECEGSFSWLDEEDDSDAFNAAWADYKNKFAKLEAAQERKAFMSDPDMRTDVAVQPRVTAATQALLDKMAKMAPAGVKISKPKDFDPTPEQLAVFDWVKNCRGKNLVVEALAGTGKTRTGVEMLNYVPRNSKVLYTAFNAHIAAEMAEKVKHLPNVKVATYNSVGFSAVRYYARSQGIEVVLNESKTDLILSTVLDKNLDKPIFPIIITLVKLVKSTLAGSCVVEDGLARVYVSDDELNRLVEYYGVEIESTFDISKIFDAVRIVLNKDVNMLDTIDFDDQVWLPVVLNMSCFQYDFMFIDEAQDTNKTQIALALKSVKTSGRIVAVGDRYQSIYAFRGADSDAIPNLISALNADTLPLSVSFRNPKVVVGMVNQDFPHIPLKAASWAVDGVIRHSTDEKFVPELNHKDLIICRTNAPLVHPAFELIRKGIKAVIRGRSIGKGLITLVRKMKTNDIHVMLTSLREYHDAEYAKLSDAGKSAAAQALNDNFETIVALCDGISNVAELEIRINGVFSDKVEGVTFSSIHRAKGLEADRIYLMRPDLLPHPSAKQDWEMQQEANLEYVAKTRPRKEFIFVHKTTK